MSERQLRTIVLGGGCFWGTEAVFRRVPGVVSVVSGYTGGRIENPSHEQVLSGISGHVQVIVVEYDEAQITLPRLLDLFFLLHNPTTLNRQGNDIGPQYRSAIYFTDPLEEAEITLAVARSQEEHNHPLVTEVKELGVFYRADEEHQDYYTKNTGNSYSTIIIGPKLVKLKKVLEKQSSV